MRLTRNTTLVVCLAAAITSIAVYPVFAKDADPIGPKLTPRLKQMLSEEMLSVRQATKQILDGLIVGDHSLVATQAQQIHDSFILQRALTEQDKKDLMKAASPEFLQLDGEFHMTAKKLSEAAKHKDYELQRFYYSRLVNSCQACHSQFATDRFPAFSGAQPEGHSH
jgi:cytochrome c556